MIFLSHNSNDKAVVEQVAIKLKGIYGQENVFYDSWSIQPGDGIIDKMEQGLTNCQYFFFFVSKNSLKSNLVKMEWQNALFKAAQNAIKFIPIRLDTSTLPILLTQSLYVDLFSNGLDVAIRQIVDVVNGTNTYRESSTQFSNLVAYKYWDGDKLIVECHAQHYLEPVSYFIFCSQSDIDMIDVTVKNENMHMGGEMKNIKLENGYVTNSIMRGIERGTLPNFPFIVEFKSKNNTTFDIEAIMHKKSHDMFTPIPVINGRK